MKERIEASEIINRYKKPLLNAGVILVALIISFKIYSGQEKNINILKENKDKEIKRNEALEDISRLEAQLAAYKDFLNKKDISSLIKRLGDIARSSSVKIISIKPENAKETPNYTIYPFNLSISAEGYHQLGKFGSELEKNPDIYIINSLMIKPASSSGESRESAGLQAEIRLSTILYKD